MEVGFEPTEDLRLHTLSSTAHHRSPASASVRACANTTGATAGERWRTGVNETKTEPRPGVGLSSDAAAIHGVTGLEGADSSPVQAALVALTRNVYVVPRVSPVMVVAGMPLVEGWWSRCRWPR